MSAPDRSETSEPAAGGRLLDNKILGAVVGLFGLYNVVRLVGVVAAGEVDGPAAGFALVLSALFAVGGLWVAWLVLTGRSAGRREPTPANLGRGRRTAVIATVGLLGFAMTAFVLAVFTPADEGRGSLIGVGIMLGAMGLLAAQLLHVLHRRQQRD